MKTLIPLLMMLALASCVTQKKCNSKFPPSTDIQVKDSIIIRDSIIYKDRLVPYKIPGDTVWKDKIIPGIPEKINTSPIYLDNTYATAKAWIENSRLKLELIQKDQVITFKLDSADKVAKHWEYKWRNEKQTITLPPEKYIPKIYKHALSICIFEFAVVFLFIGWKLYKFFKK